MTAFRELAIMYIGLFQMFCLMTVVTEIYALISAFYQKRTVLYRAAVIMQLVLGLVWFCGLLDGTYTVDYADRARSYPAFVNIIYDMPAAVVAGISLLFAAAAAACAVSSVRFRKRRVSRGSIKDTVDKLPVGICYSRPDGTVMLKNLRMEELCRQIAGRALNDAVVFSDAVTQKGEKRGEDIFCTLPDKSVARFTRESVELGGEEYELTLAFDVTEQYGIITELEEKNKKLKDIRVRMRAFGEETSRLAMSEEILKARVTVHDEVGHILLCGKYFLENPGETDEESLLRLAKHTNTLLTREGEEPDDAEGDPVEDGADMARAIGVTVVISGEQPEDSEARGILGHAIRECAANTAKHAEGDTLDVRISRREGAGVYELRSSGRAPDAPVKEAGGLLLLREKVEAAGGSMRILCDPYVTVEIIIPDKK